ncbi:MAG: sporulation integral membrane protein YtvI [Clostridia bacterium]|nr:sporulation integral membrane protein YtvI [Clostridia bacterium]
MDARKKFIIDAGYYGIIGIAALLVFQYILPIMVPFIIAFIVAGLLQLTLDKMDFKHTSMRKLASIGLCSIFYLIVFVIVLVVGSRLIKETGDLVRAIPRLFSELVPFINRGFDELEVTVAAYDTNLAKVIDQMATSTLKTISQTVTDFSAKALILVTGYATSIPGIIVNVVITVISTFFMAIDFDLILSFLKKLIPSSKKELVDTSLHYAKSMIGVYIKSYTLLFTLTFIELTVGFALLKVPYAVLLALIIAIFDLLPILGTGGILLPWALILVVMGNLKLAAGIAALYVIITAVRQTLEPKIVGAQIGLHPLATLISMLVGLRLFGLVGLIAFPVTLAVITAMNRSRNARIQAEARKQQQEAPASPESEKKAAAKAKPQKKKNPMSRIRARKK